MAKAFNLTAEINLRGPANIRTVVADIRRQLGTVDVNINPRLNPASIRNINTMNTALRALNGTLSITTTNARAVSDALRDLGQSFNGVIGRNTQQGLNNASQNINAVATNAGRASTQMEEFGRQSALAVRRFAAFTVVTSTIYAFTGALRQGVSDFIAFDKEFVRLQQVTGESAKSLQSLSKAITNLSVGLGVSSQELTTVAVTLAQAGLSASDTQKSLKALALSALAPSFDDMNQTVEGSIALMRQFDISAGDLESALGSINAVAAKFAVEASDIITAIQRTGGVFATASKGVSEGTDALNEFIAVFTSVRATTRESAETIATGLRTIFTRVQRAETIQALERFGVTLTDLEGKFVGPFEAVKRLSEGLSRLDPRDLQFSQIVEELGGFRQIGKVIPLIQQFAVAQEALKTAQTGQASLAADAATAQLSIANQIAKVREEFTALIRSIGESDSFRSFVSLSLQLASALIKLADAAKIVLPALTALATIKGLSALTQFGAGFAGAFGAAGGARGLGQRLGGGRRFASGGLVPGSGNRDTVSAMLTPGEFVIRKKAVESIGINNLRSMNRYAGGGFIQKFAQPFPTPESGRVLGRSELAKQLGIRPNDMTKGGIDRYKLLGEKSTRGEKYRRRLSRLAANKKQQENLDTINGIILNKTFGISFLDGGVSEISANIRDVLSRGNQTGIDELNKFIGSKKIGRAAKIIAPQARSATLSQRGQEIFDKSLINGLPDLFDKAVKELPSELNPPAKKVNIRQLISNSGIQAIKGYFFEAFIRRASSNLIPDNLSDKTDPIFDFAGAGNKSILKRLFGERFVTPNEFKVSPTTENIANAISKAVATSRQSSLQAFANGGSVEDSVPALLTPGEFVINKRAAQRIGSARLNKLNKADKIQGFNRGGSVGTIQSFAYGGGVQTFIAGGMVAAVTSFSRILPQITRAFTSLAGNIKNVSGTFTQFGNRVSKVNIGIPKTGAGTARAGGARAGSRDFTNQGSAVPQRGMGGMGAFIAITAGGAAVEGAASIAGGERGERIRTVGSDILNYGAIGAGLGSIFGPLGGIIGGLVGGIGGAISGFLRMGKAVDEFNEKIRQTEVQNIGEVLNSSIERWSKQNIPINDEIANKFRELQQREAPSLTGTNLQQPIGDIVSQNKTAADAAIKIIETEMRRTGKTFAEVSSSFDPELFKQLQLAIVETNAEYIQTVIDLSKATDPKKQKKLKEKQADLLASYNKLTFAAEDLQIIEKQRAAEAAKIVKEIDKTLDIYRRANAYADKYAAALDTLVKATEARVNDFSNAPKVQSITRKNEEVLGNLSAFSFEEVRAAAGGVAGLAGGSPEAKALADQAVASKILADQLPALVKSTSIENRASIKANLEGLFKAQGINIDTTEIQGVLSDIGNRLKEAASDTNIDKLTEELEQAVVGPLSKRAEEGAKLLQKLAKTYNDTLQTAVDLQNQYNEAISQSNEYTRRAGIIRINAELDLAKALGNSPTLQQLNEPFDFEIRDLTRGLREVGGLGANQATDPAAIGLAMMRTSKENARLEAETAANLAEAKGFGADEAGNAKRAELASANIENIAALGKNKLALEEGRKALEKLANDGTKAANALAKIQEEQQKIEGFGNFLQKIATAGFDELFQMNRESAALAAARAGGPEFMRNVENRQLAFAGLEAQRELYSPEEFANVRADLLTKFYESQGFAGQDFVPKLGMTLAQAMERIRGRVSEQDPNVIAYREAVNEQIKANEVLALLNKQQALIIQESMLDLQVFLAKDFPNILIQALRDARADAAAANPRNIPAAGNLPPIPAQANSFDEAFNAGFAFAAANPENLPGNIIPAPPPPGQGDALDRLNAQKAQLEVQRQSLEEQMAIKIGEMAQPNNRIVLGAKADLPLTQLNNPAQVIPAPLPPGITGNGINFVSGEDVITRAAKDYAPTPQRKAFVLNELKEARKRQRAGQKLPSDDSVISASVFELRNLQKVKLPTENKPLTPYQQMMASRRQQFLSRFRPEVRERMMTKAENGTMQPKVSTTIPQPTITGPRSQVLPTTGGGGPTGGAGFQMQLDPGAQGFLDTLQSTFNSFNTYIDKLSAVASTIPSKIELTGNYVLDVQISGAAAFEALSNEMKRLAVSLIEPKLQQLRDEVSSATGGQVRSSASIGGYKGDVNVSPSIAATA